MSVFSVVLWIVNGFAFLIASAVGAMIGFMWGFGTSGDDNWEGGFDRLIETNFLGGSFIIISILGLIFGVDFVKDSLGAEAATMEDIIMPGVATSLVCGFLCTFLGFVVASMYDFLTRLFSARKLKPFFTKGRLGFCAVLLIPFCLFGGVGMLKYREWQEMETVFGEALLSMCRSEYYDDVGTFPSFEGSPRFLIIEESGLPGSWHRKLPENLRADGAEEVDLVVCLDYAEDVEVSECEYTGWKVIRRFRLARNVFVVDPQTGKTVASTTLYGDAPVCPQVTDTSKSITGTQPKFDSLLTWLRAL